MRALGKVQQLVLATLLFGGIALLPSQSLAQTAAGTLITNTATANYQVSGVAATPIVAAIAFNVDEIIDVQIVSTDASGLIDVDTPATDEVLTFEISNTGNGTEDFTLVFDDALAGDQFDPTGTTLFVESNGTLGLQATGGSPDTVYVGSVGNIAAGGTLTVYVQADIPGALTHLDEGDVQLTVEPTTAGAGGAAAGTVLAGLGDTGVDAIVGNTQDNNNNDATGTYRINTVTVDMTKAVLLIDDGFDGSPSLTDLYIPTAIVTYRITVDITGGSITNLVITDPIPTNTTYVTGSIFVNANGGGSTLQTDTVDGDFADFTDPTITVDIGAASGGDQYLIDISVTID
jgi:uncharacterized repeat protein (TIGR01451 family)